MTTKNQVDPVDCFNQMRRDRIEALLQSVKENQRLIVVAQQNIARLKKIVKEYED